MSISSAQKKSLIAWCFYDWAASGFPIVVTTFIFATYFTTQVADNEIHGTYLWANAMALSGIIVAIASPIFGAIADDMGHHKRWLFLFTFICIVSSSLLWFSYPDKNVIGFTLAVVVVGTIGLEIAAVFYNSFLIYLAPNNYIGRISGWAWGLGYIGGILILSIVLFGFVKYPPSWLDVKTAEEIRICGPWVAIWYAVFSLPLFLFVKDTPRTSLSVRKAIFRGLREMGHTLKTLPTQKNLMLFLIAHLIYIDGLNTLFAFGGIYAAGTFHMNLPSVILFGLTMNIAAGIGAILLAWVDDYVGSKKTILISLLSLIGFGIMILVVKEERAFWVGGLLLSLFLGPLQAASRSLMARITPLQKSTEYFGLYAFSGRITSFVGPWLLGIVTLTFQSQRAGMATILFFFLVGGGVMCFVQEAKSKKLFNE